MTEGCRPNIQALLYYVNIHTLWSMYVYIYIYAYIYIYICMHISYKSISLYIIHIHIHIHVIMCMYINILYTHYMSHFHRKGSQCVVKWTCFTIPLLSHSRGTGSCPDITCPWAHHPSKNLQHRHKPTMQLGGFPVVFVGLQTLLTSSIYHLHISTRNHWIHWSGTPKTWPHCGPWGFLGPAKLGSFLGRQRDWGDWSRK